MMRAKAYTNKAPPATGRRFRVSYTGDIVWVQMDRTSHFDGEKRTAWIFGLQLGAAGGVWEKFAEEDVTYE